MIRNPSSKFDANLIMAIVPFYVGFFVNEQSLHLIRVLRIFRLLQVYRNSVVAGLLGSAIARVLQEDRANQATPNKATGAR